MYNDVVPLVSNNILLLLLSRETSQNQNIIANFYDEFIIVQNAKAQPVKFYGSILICRCLIKDWIYSNKLKKFVFV